MPLQHLPVYHRTRKDIDFVVILRVRMPQFWGLPIDRADQTSNHGSRGLLDLGESKVRNLRRPFRCDEDVRRFAISMND